MYDSDNYNNLIPNSNGKTEILNSGILTFTSNHNKNLFNTIQTKSSLVR